MQLGVCEMHSRKLPCFSVPSHSSSKYFNLLSMNLIHEPILVIKIKIEAVAVTVAVWSLVDNWLSEGLDGISFGRVDFVGVSEGGGIGRYQIR